MLFDKYSIVLISVAKRLKNAEHGKSKQNRDI